MPAIQLAQMNNPQTPPTTEAPDFAATLIIPAHNEATVIGQLLDSLPRQIYGRPLQIIVACNGCSDGTAEVARTRNVTVVEVAAASKIAALNAAEEVASAFPRLYIDADIGISPRTIQDVVAALSTPGALCAAPPADVQLSGRPWIVKAYLSFLRRLSDARGDFVGSGVYALSADGRARFGRFPDLIADDRFVRNRFSRRERIQVETAPTIVQAPRTVTALFRQRVRGIVGNLQLAERGLKEPPSDEPAHTMTWWKLALRHPGLMPSAIAYAAFNAIARVVATHRMRAGGPVDWGRDHTTR